MSLIYINLTLVSQVLFQSTRNPVRAAIAGSIVIRAEGIEFSGFISSVPESSSLMLLATSLLDSAGGLKRDSR